MTGEPPAGGLGERDGWRDVPASWPVDNSKKLLGSRLITVTSDTVRFPDGTSAERIVVAHPGAVAVLALDEDDRILMIRQYRHPVRRMLWEIPAGLRDVAGEPPLEAARRELAEESGYRARDWHVLADFFTSPGYSDERIRVYLARGLEEIPVEERDVVLEHEEAFLERGWLDLRAGVSAVLGGDLHNGVTALAILAGFAAYSGDIAGLRPADAPE